MKNALLIVIFFALNLTTDAFAQTGGRPAYPGITRCPGGAAFRPCVARRLIKASNIVVAREINTIPTSLGYNLRPRPRKWREVGKKLRDAMCAKDAHKCRKIVEAAKKFAGVEAVYQLNPDPSIAEQTAAKNACIRFHSVVRATVNRVKTVSIDTHNYKLYWKWGMCEERYGKPQRRGFGLGAKRINGKKQKRRIRIVHVPKKFKVVIDGPSEVTEGGRGDYTVMEPECERGCSVDWDVVTDDGTRRLPDCKNNTSCNIPFPKKGRGRVQAKVCKGRRCNTGKKIVVVVAKPPAIVSVTCKKEGADDSEYTQAITVKTGDRVVCKAESRDGIKWVDLLPEWQAIVEFITDDGTKSARGNARKPGTILITATSTSGPGRGSARITVEQKKAADKAPVISLQGEEAGDLDITDNANGTYTGSVKTTGKKISFTWYVAYSEPLKYERGVIKQNGRAWVRAEKPAPKGITCKPHPSPQGTRLWDSSYNGGKGRINGAAILCSGTPTENGKYIIRAYAWSKTGLRAKPKALYLTVGDGDNGPRPKGGTIVQKVQKWIFGERFRIAVSQLWGQHGSSATDDTPFLKTDTTLILQYWFVDWIAGGFNIDIQNHQIFRFFRKDDFGGTTRFNFQLELRYFTDPEKTHLHAHVAARIVGRLPSTENKSANNTAEGLSVAPGAAVYGIAAIGYQWEKGYVCLEIPGMLAALTNGQQATIGAFAHLFWQIHKPYFFVEIQLGVLASLANQSWNPENDTTAPEWLTDVIPAFIGTAKIGTIIPGFGRIEVSFSYIHEWPGAKYRGTGEYGFANLAVGESRIPTFIQPLDLTNLTKGGGSAAANVKP